MHRDAIKDIDSNTLAGIGSEKDWSKKNKQEAIKILSGIEKSEERRTALSEIKKKIREDKDLDVEEAYESYIEEVDESVGESFDVYLNAKERKITKEVAKKLNLEINTLIKKNHINWLKKEGYL